MADPTRNTANDATTTSSMKTESLPNQTGHAYIEEREVRETRRQRKREKIVN
jgi:hypothetical protein